MHMQQPPQAALHTSAGDIQDLLALLQGEPESEAHDRVIETAEKSIQEQGIETLLGLIRRRHAIHLRYSSGKDSSSCAVLVIEAVRRAVAEGITTTHYISSSSTGVACANYGEMDRLLS